MAAHVSCAPVAPTVCVKPAAQSDTRLSLAVVQVYVAPGAALATAVHGVQATFPASFVYSPSDPQLTVSAVVPDLTWLLKQESMPVAAASACSTGRSAAAVSTPSKNAGLLAVQPSTQPWKLNAPPSQMAYGDSASP